MVAMIGKRTRSGRWGVWALLALGLLAAVARGEAPADARLDESRAKRLEIEKRMKNLQVQIRDWEQKEAYHEKQAELGEKYLDLKQRDRAYFTRILAEIEQEIDRAETRNETQQSEQALREDRFQGRLKVFAQSAANVSADSSMQTMGRVVAAMTRARCRQLAGQALRGREEMSRYSQTLADLYDTQASYRAFADRADKKDSVVRADVERSRASIKTFEELRKEGAQKLQALEAEQQQLQGLIATLHQQFAPPAPPPTASAPPAAAVAVAPPAPAKGSVPASAARAPEVEGFRTTAPAKAGVAPSETAPPLGVSASAVAPPLIAMPVQPGTAALLPPRVIVAPEGAPVRAAESGQIWFANSLEGWGELVVIKHDGDYVTVYGYLGELLVRPGINVYKGQEIGRVGPVNGSSAFGVRFEIRGGSGGQKSIAPEQWGPTSGDLRAAILGAGQ